METHLFLQVLGYVASALVAASLMMKSLLRLRVINLFGAGLMATYGLLIHAWPVAVLNGTIVLVDLYYLNQMWRQRDYFKLLAIDHDSEYMRGFVDYHRDDIAGFIPGYAFRPDATQHHLLVLRNMVPAGLVILQPEGGTARVLLDYVIPGYRDFGVGKFLFEENAAWFRERGISRLVSEAGAPRHADYLGRMGFRREGDSFVRELGMPAARGKTSVMFRAPRLLIATLVPLAVARAAVAAPARAPVRAPADPWKTHAALVERDNTLYMAGQYDAVAMLMDSLLAAPGVTSDPGLLRIALTRRSRAHLMLFEYEPAARVSGRAFRLAEAAKDTATMIRALRVRVVALEKTGDIDLATSLCARGAAMAKRRNQPRDESYLHTRHGYALLAQGRSREGAPWFERAAAVAARNGDENDELRAVAGLASAQYQVGRLIEARASYARGIALARKLDNSFELAFLCLNNAEMERAIGDPDASPELAYQAIDASRRSAQLSVELKARGLLASYEAARGAFDRVDSLMSAALPLAEPLGDRAALSEILLSLARARIELGRAEEGEALIRRAAALVDTLVPVNAAFASQMIVYSLHTARRDADAVRWADDLIARLVRRMPAASFWRVRFYRSIALQSLGRHREALVGFRETAAITRPTATTPGGVEYDWALALEGKSLHGIGAIDSSIASYRRSIAAWERVRSARSREELLLDSEDYGLEIGCGLAFALLDPRRAAPRDRRTIEAFSELQRFHALAVTERLLGPAAGAEARRKPFDFAAWRQHTLRPGEVFVDVTPDEDSTLVIAVTRRDVRAWTLPGAKTMDQRLARFAELVASAGAEDATVRQVAAALGADLFGPGAELVRGASRVLVAGGRISNAPLGLLIVPGTNGPLALERELSIVPSAKLLAIARSRTGARAGVQRTLVAVARTLDDRGRRLAAAGEEVRALGRTYRSAAAFVDPQRSAPQIAREMLGTGDIVHLAAHTSADLKHPWRSRLLLGDPARRDAYLPVASISRLKLPARLCVLASCRSLGNAGLENMSLAGLAPAWLMAGVPTVVATQWDVDDRATAEFMRRFYGALSAGRTVGAALQQAQRELRAMPEWSAPKFWSGFVVLGDPGTKVVLAPKR